MAKDTRKYWIDKNRLKDPMMWFMKAYAYASICRVIRKECGKVLYIKENPELKINAIRAVPYLTGLASELFMKGYLISKGNSEKDVTILKHNLKNIREKCLEYGDKRFDNDNLKFLTDTCGDQLMEEGGIRYPDKHEMIAFPEFVDALDILQNICSDVEGKLMNVKESEV